jgi:hypothetical protein
MKKKEKKVLNKQIPRDDLILLKDVLFNLSERMDYLEKFLDGLMAILLQEQTENKQCCKTKKRVKNVNTKKNNKRL